MVRKVTIPDLISLPIVEPRSDTLKNLHDARGRGGAESVLTLVAGCWR